MRGVKNNRKSNLRISYRAVGDNPTVCQPLRRRQSSRQTDGIPAEKGIKFERLTRNNRLILFWFHLDCVELEN